MKFKLSLMLLCIFIAGFCLAQEDSTRVLQYQVTGDKSNKYSIFPLDDYLFVGCNNKIKITANDLNELVEVRISNGKIVKNEKDGSYIISGLIGGIAMLSLYEKDKKGNEIVVKNKRYTVINYPQLNLGGTKCDSVISRILLCGGLFFAEFKDKQYKSPVLSFKMDMYRQNKFSQDSSNTNKLSADMRAYVSGLSAGAIVYLTDIKFKHIDGSIKTEPIFRLFIGNESAKPFGF